MPMREHWSDFTYERAETCANRPGVYEVGDRGYKTIYIGSSRFLQDALFELLRTNNALHEAARGFRWEFADNPQERLAELLEEYKQQNGKAPQFNEVASRAS